MLIHTSAQYLLTDSRQLIFPEQTLFFAIKGQHHDGHAFLQALYDKGVRAFVVETKALDAARRTMLAGFEDCTIWEVENAVKALQQLAQAKREKYAIPVVGITGSNGKTIVKEWLTQLMAYDEQVVKSPKSYNSQIGVPLSVWQMEAGHTLGVFEAGISQPHEMQALQQIIQPTVGIFTNIGSAHDEGFRSRKQKVTEKLRLFTHCKTLIFCHDYPDIEEETRLILRSVNPHCEMISWGIKTGGTLRVEFQTPRNIRLVSDDKRFENLLFRLPFEDAASVENLLHCIVFMRYWGINAFEIQRRIDRLRPVSMRLELKEGINRCYLIDDTYNNDLVGLTMALSFLDQQQHRLDKVVILSDLLQTGQNEAELYAQIATLLAEKGIDKIIGIGEAFTRNAAVFSEALETYPTTDDFLQQFQYQHLHDALVLVKGARMFQFERIVQRLQQKVHGTVLEINLDALTHNLNFYRNRIGSDTRIMVMVKSFAYGSGSAEVAQLLQFHRVDYLAVAYADEGVALRQNGITLPIMVMNPAADTFDKLLEYRLEPEIYSFKIFQELIIHLKEASFGGVGAFGVHLKLDTGMHRLGFAEADLPKLIEILRLNPQFRVASVFSHLVGADEATHNEFSKLQYERFVRGAAQIEEALGYRSLRHIVNSAGIVRFPDYKLDMVRLGIGLYGVEVNKYEQRALQPIGTLKTVVSQVKHLPAGETVGYSRQGVLEKPATIATIAIGYGDGYDRRFSKGVGKVLINGVMCPVVGNVCMDMTMIDATEAHAQEGDEVIVFGPQLPITQLAEAIGTIPYEVLTGISERVKRVFYYDFN